MTAPRDEDFIRDIELTKAMGFSGVRKHQKVEDPRYLYHADRLGLLVWGEIGAAHRYTEKAARRMYNEWLDAVERDYNHPCIVAWVPLNENWGVNHLAKDPVQQAHSQALVYMTKSLDPTRPVIDNDGWMHTRGDLLTIHDYTSQGDALEQRYASMESILTIQPEGRPLFVGGHGYQGQPVLVTEFGGVKYAPESAEEKAWGYCETADAAAYAAKLAELTGALLASPWVQGYCYTQLDIVRDKQKTTLDGILILGKKSGFVFDDKKLFRLNKNGPSKMCNMYRNRVGIPDLRKEKTPAGHRRMVAAAVFGGMREMELPKRKNIKSRKSPNADAFVYFYCGDKPLQ